MDKQELKLSINWQITFHDFYKSEPDFNDAENPNWFDFKEDMLQIENKKLSLLIDLGWSPSFNISGNFTLLLIKLGDWDNPLRRFESKSPKEIVAQIQEWAK